MIQRRPRLPRRAYFLSRITLLATVGVMSVFAPPAWADSVQGNGRAMITKDTASVQATAELAARRDIIRSMLIRTIGNDRLSEVTPDMIDSMAGQIRSDMISGQTSERMGKDFIVHLSADIDGAWFATMLSDFGIDSSSMRADNDRQLILVYIDQAQGTASDFTQPAEATFEYDRQTGGSFSDQSEVTSSEKEASGSSYRHSEGSNRASSAAASSRGAGAYRGYGASAWSGASASGSTSKASHAENTRSSTAYASSSAYRDKSDVNAEVHDNVRIRSHVVYQQPPRSVEGDAIRNGLNGALGDFGVQPADAWMALSSYFPAGVPQYDDLKRDPAFEGFLRSLKARNTPFFMGGSFAVTQEGRDPASGYALCSGNLDAGAAASNDGRVIASGTFPAQASGSSPENCTAQLTRKLADAAASELGPRIQRYWRAKARAATGQDTRQLANYTLVLRATSLDMNLQQDLMDAISATPGAKLEAFVSSDAQTLQVTVSYAGTMPLQFALFGQLRSKAAFAGMQSSVEGRAITMCLSACGAGL